MILLGLWSLVVFLPPEDRAVTHSGHLLYCVTLPLPGSSYNLQVCSGSERTDIKHVVIQILGGGKLAVAFLIRMEVFFISGEKVTGCSTRTLNSEMLGSSVAWLMCVICVLMSCVIPRHCSRTQDVPKTKNINNLSTRLKSDRCFIMTGNV